MFDALRLVADDLTTNPRLVQLLNGAHQLGGNFSGLGIVFCKTADAVPHIPIYSEPHLRKSPDVCSLLIERANLSNSYHDGFNILTPNWEPVALGVFLSPPLPMEPLNNPGNNGSRWIAASLTSRLLGVIACLTISQIDRQVMLFVGGCAEQLIIPAVP